jgi:hypothetical protein
MHGAQADLNQLLSHNTNDEGVVGCTRGACAPQFFTLGGKFPRLTRREAKARLKEIKKLLLVV